MSNGSSSGYRTTRPREYSAAGPGIASATAAQPPRCTSLNRAGVQITKPSDAALPRATARPTIDQIWSQQGSVHEHSGQKNLVPEECSTNTARGCCSKLSFNFDTVHGLFSPGIFSYRSQSCIGTAFKKRNHTKIHMKPGWTQICVRSASRFAF